MAQKYRLIVDFLSDFVKDVPGVRCAVLKDDVAGMTTYNLSPTAIDKLHSLKTQDVLDELVRELKGLGIDLDAKRKEVDGGRFGALERDSRYSNKFIHFRGCDHDKVFLNVPTVLVFRGNGFDDKEPDIRFTHESGAEIHGTVLGVDCDVDLYQRVMVWVTLDSPGKWTVDGKNPDDPQWNVTKNTIDLEVVQQPQRRAKS